MFNEVLSMFKERFLPFQGLSTFNAKRLGEGFGAPPRIFFWGSSSLTSEHIILGRDKGWPLSK